MGKGKEVATTVEVEAVWQHNNVVTCVFVEHVNDNVCWIFAEQTRVYSTFSTAGEAKSYEPSDIGSAITGLRLADGCIRSVSKRCRWLSGIASEFDAPDRKVITRDAFVSRQATEPSWINGEMLTTVFPNQTPNGFTAYKVEQTRFWRTSGVVFGSRFLFAWNIRSAVQGLTAAKQWLEHDFRNRSKGSGKSRFC